MLDQQATRMLSKFIRENSKRISSIRSRFTWQSHWNVRVMILIYARLTWSATRNFGFNSIPIFSLWQVKYVMKLQARNEGYISETNGEITSYIWTVSFPSSSKDSSGRDNEFMRHVTARPNLSRSLPLFWP